MNIYRVLKGLAYFTTVFLFVWFFVLKIVGRIAAHFGHSSPCPASLAWLVDNPLRQLYMRPVLSRVGIEPGEQVLELGPGPGSFTVAAARQAGPEGRLLAIDIQPKMIAQVEGRVQPAGLSNVETRVAGVDNLPIADQSIDRAFLISVLGEVPDQDLGLSELKRVLRPEGILSITAEFTDPDYLFAGETVRLLERNGFKLVAKHGNWWCHTLNFRPVEGSALGSSYYVAREQSLLSEFDDGLRRVRSPLVRRYGEVFVSTVTADARARFQRLIPELPYVGGKSNPMTFNVVSTAWMVALYRALQAQGKGIDEAGPLVLEIYQAWLDSYPAWLLRLRGRWAFSPMFQRRLERRSRLSKARRYPGNWVFSYIGKNGHDFGVDYTECAILKFCQAQDATELMPYLCSVDFIMSERMDLGLERPTTLAQGDAVCNFRFKRGRPTSWPAGLQEEVGELAGQRKRRTVD